MDKKAKKRAKKTTGGDQPPAVMLKYTQAARRWRAPALLMEDWVLLIPANQCLLAFKAVAQEGG